MDGVVSRLKDLVPPRFEDLKTEFAVGGAEALAGRRAGKMRVAACVGQY